MRPSEARERVLADHASLRLRLDEIEGLARSIREGTADRENASRLRVLCEELLAELARHMEWEDLHLARALRDADAWGEERERRLVDEHREQRGTLREVLDALRDSSRSAERVVDDMLSFAVWLRRDMGGEEDERLGANLLRDDLVGIDVETG